MSPRNKPPFRADHVGSLLRPKTLLAAREQRARNEISAAELTQREDDAIRDAVKLQEEVGLKVATDGEFRRAMWHTDFLSRFINVDVVPGKIKVRFQSFDGETELEPPGTVVTGKLAWPPGGIFVDDFKFLGSAVSAGVTPKITIPSPSTMHFRGGRAAIDRHAYPDMGEFYADLARAYAQEVHAFANAGCRYLQIDEVNFAFLCDPKLREEVRTTLGEDPDRLPHTYAKLINSSIAACTSDTVVCLHLCRGNAMSSWLAQGGYEPVAEVLFNEVAVDGYFLEYDTARAGSCPRVKPLCSAWSRPSKARWRAKTISNVALMRPRAIARSSNWRSARNAGSRAARLATKSRLMMKCASCAWSSRRRARYGASEVQVLRLHSNSGVRQA
jgi:5-methyltetrahydropteroyltriglutamate--homocysteine methyltransferase